MYRYMLLYMYIEKFCNVLCMFLVNYHVEKGHPKLLIVLLYLLCKFRKFDTLYVT